MQKLKETKSELQRLIDSNPCSSCRHLRLPKCQCMELNEVVAISADEILHIINENKLTDDRKGNDDQAEANQSNSDKVTIDRTTDLTPVITDDNISVIWNDTLSKLFDITYNHFGCALTCKPKNGRKETTPDEEKLWQGFLQYLLRKFNEFKLKMAALGIDVANFTAQLSNPNSLTIRIPQYECYDKFVNELLNHLHPKKEKQHRHLNPFKMEPEPR